MSNDEIMKIARDSGLHEFLEQELPAQWHWEKLELLLPKFAKMVVTAEREACAEICDNTIVEPGDQQMESCHEAAAAIRARGTRS